MRGADIWCLLVVVSLTTVCEVSGVSSRLPRTSAVQQAAAAAAQNKTIAQLRSAQNNRTLNAAAAGATAAKATGTRARSSTVTKLNANEQHASETRFPVDKDLRRKWVIAIRRENFEPSASSAICSKHFKPTDYDNKFGKILLKKNAVPSIFDFPKHLQAKQSARSSPKKRCCKQVLDSLDQDHESIREQPSCREQYLFNVFETIISTLDSKLQRIENLDKAVEHLMRRVESLDTRVNNNIGKTDSVIAKLRNLDSKLFQTPNKVFDISERKVSDSHGESNTAILSQRLVSLDQKVSDIDDKLNTLKNQLDNNYLQNEDINVEASEKRPVSMNVVEITKALNTEVLNHVTKELGQLKEATNNVDKKLQFHINIMSEKLGSVLHMMTDVHHALVDDSNSYQKLKPYNRTTTTTTTTTSRPELPRTNKIDNLMQQIKPIISVSEKMDEVWNVVVGTKSSVDDLVPKSDELLTQTQRQERAIGEIHSDLRSKTNKIIANLDKVEKRLKKQEDDVATLAQRPAPAEILLDPTINDRPEEYDSTRYEEDFATDTTLPFGFTTPPSPQSNTHSPFLIHNDTASTTEKRHDKRKGGVIFPSVKNKPVPLNTTFITAESLPSVKDIKGYSCVDLLNVGMRDSGVYYLQIRGTTFWFLKVFCEQEIADGGWTVIQRRDDFGNPRENFNRNWNDYKNGFGDPAKEFWLGNENIYMLTNNEEYSLRVELEDFEGNKRYAQYAHFKIYSEAEYYKLEIDGYEGNAGDSLNDPWYGSNNSPFSTYNRDNDRSSLNCASMLKGGWWWKSCGRGLNGLYLNDPQDLTARQGIVWFRWRGWDYTLKKAVMMIKPKNFVTGT